MKKGRLSFWTSVILLLVGFAFLVTGILYNIKVLDESLSSFLGIVEREVGVTFSGKGLIDAGLFILLEGLLVAFFRLRKPYSMMIVILLVPTYFTLQTAYRLSHSLPISSLLPPVVNESRSTLMYILFVLEILLLLVLLALFKGPDEKWRKKREIQIKMLEREGAIKSRETLKEEKLLKRQRKLNEKEESQRKKEETKYLKQLEKKEEAEKKKEERINARDKKEYEKNREREEEKRIREEEKEKRKRDKQKDKLIEKEEIEREKSERRNVKEEKKRAKEIKREKKKEARVDDSFDIGPMPEYDRGIGNPDTPLSFPEFALMPDLKTIGHHAVDDEKDAIEEKKTPLIESSSFMDNLKDEIDKESERGENLFETKHFKGGGMLEATLESLNGDVVSTPCSNLRPIIGLDDEEEEKDEIHSSYSSFAPSNLDPSHPRYRLFENLQHPAGESIQTQINDEKSEEKKQTIAPSNLDPSHPRYRLFENLQHPAGESIQTPINDEKSETIAPSNLDPSHPRYRLFENLQNKEGGLDRSKPNLFDVLDEKKSETLTTVSYTPSRPFIEEEKSVVHSAYPSSTIIEDVGHKSFSSMKEEESISEDSIERNEEIKTNLSEKIIEEPYTEPQMQRVRSVREDDNGHRVFEVKGEEEVEDDFNLLVGVGDLASNRAGLTAIKIRQNTQYTPPEISLLKDYPVIRGEIDSYTREQGEIIVKTLAEQKVVVELSNIIKGPAVTMYELRLAQGMIISKIKAREDEINYALGGKKVRILAPVPGKQAVGIEVPNERISVVGFKDMLYAMNEHSEYNSFAVPMILGRTVTGEPIVIDCAKMPHMIIAGTTGSGKSVCINTFINTILYKKSPKDVRLILVDPKVVELTVYNGIPHLLTPVITDSKRALKALDWLVCEMERRYAMLAHYSLRNIKGLNEKIASGELKGVEKVPYIVLIMDEFADIMAVVGKEMDAAISRIAAKARAAGIHMILATQRPSSDVILGTLKSNLPGRIAFAVSSGINSRVILDEMGAENLLGKGDMLLLDPSSMGTRRIQGAFVSDDEVERISSFVLDHNSSAEFLEESVFEETESLGDGEEEFFDDEGDEDLYEAAKKIVYERKSASASYLQRRLKIGYNRAARIVEQMEEDGIVGPANGSKPREILKYE